MGNVRRMMVTGKQALQTLSLSPEEVELVKLARECGGVDAFRQMLADATGDSLVVNAADGHDGDYIMPMPELWPSAASHPTTQNAADDGLAEGDYTLPMPAWPQK